MLCSDIPTSTQAPYLHCHCCPIPHLACLRLCRSHHCYHPCPCPCCPPCASLPSSSCIREEGLEVRSGSGCCQSHGAESMILSACAESIILSALFGHVIMLTAAATKNNNQQYWRLPIYDFVQQCFNGAADWSAAKGGQVLPHFKHIVSEASMLPCPIVAVF